ncbi:dockerin type I repeat-containing protein [Ruminococcus sp.]|uniref:dockerin type I repeat-containing protein n=1 Tax=Ruminococcus sp. TaxID=41978 RepID=UPI0025CFC213|nr:dockerin type I repeat-containing protein [Ruminococcus sp.]
MKKKVRIAAVLTALCTSVSWAVPMASHAEEDTLAKRLKDIYSMIEVDDPSSLLDKWKDQLSYSEASRVFINDLGKILIEQRTANRINFDIKKDADFEDCLSIIKAVCPEAIVNLNTKSDLDTDLLDSSFYYLFDDDISIDDMISSDISISQAKKIFNALNDKGYIKGFYYLADSYLESSLDDLLELMDYTDSENDDFYATLEEFIEETDLDCSVDYSELDDLDLSSLIFGLTDSFQVTPDYDTSDLLSIYDIMQNGTGLSSSLSGDWVNGLFNGTEIDMFNALIGDSNCDKTFNLADAVLIMQALANPNKYSVTAQGKFNADFNDDGITVGDAQAIQNILLGLG